MPRYFFHLHNSVIARDEQGQELPSLEHAKAEAIRGARGVMAHDILEAGRINLCHWITIANESDEEELVIPFRSCVEIVEVRE